MCFVPVAYRAAEETSVCCAGSAGCAGFAGAAWRESVYVRNGRNGRERKRGRSRSMCPFCAAQHQTGPVRGRARWQETAVSAAATREVQGAFLGEVKNQNIKSKNKQEKTLSSKKMEAVSCERLESRTTEDGRSCSRRREEREQRNTSVLHMQDAVVLLYSDAISGRTGDEIEAGQRHSGHRECKCIQTLKMDKKNQEKRGIECDKGYKGANCKERREVESDLLFKLGFVGARKGKKTKTKKKRESDVTMAKRVKNSKQEQRAKREQAGSQLSAGVGRQP